MLKMRILQKYFTTNTNNTINYRFALSHFVAQI